MKNFYNVILTSFIIVSCTIIFSSCSGVKCPGNSTANTVLNKSESGKIYVPKYYVYKNNGYTFIKGHYRPIYFKQVYWKRSLRGYTTKQDVTAR